MVVGRKENVILKFVGIFFLFPLQKVVISHFDRGLISPDVPLGPQKYQHAPTSHVWECQGQWGLAVLSILLSRLGT